MYPDGISYLDIGDAYWRGDWHNAINAYWSPLYSWILGGSVKVFRSSMETEFPLVHLVNLLIYVVALSGFAFFLETFIERHKKEASKIATRSQIGIPVWAWYVVGYSFFITASLSLITISFASADMGVAAIVYFASAIILRIEKGETQPLVFVLLGLALGIGYLAKTAMLLMAFPFLVVAAVAHRRHSDSFKPVALSAVVFLITVTPFIVALSISKGKATFGDSGTINYTVNVNKVQFLIPKGPGMKHPVRRLNNTIEAYEYSKPIRGTYPLWADPSYWHEGIRPHFDLKRQLQTMALSAAECAWISFNVFLGLHVSVAILFLYLISPRPSASFARALRHWILWIPALAGIALYTVVVIEPRYVGGLFCVLWLVALSGVQLPQSHASRHQITVTVLFVALATGGIAVRDIWRTSHGVGVGEKNIATPECPKVAEALLANGLRPGDKIAVISDWLFPYRQGAYIARLARLQIIGEARPDIFWAADESARVRLVTEFGNVGAKVLFAHNPPQVGTDWQRLAGTNYYFYRIPPGTSLPPSKEQRP